VILYNIDNVNSQLKALRLNLITTLFKELAEFKTKFVETMTNIRLYQFVQLILKNKNLHNILVYNFNSILC